MVSAEDLPVGIRCALSKSSGGFVTRPFGFDPSFVVFKMLSFMTLRDSWFPEVLYINGLWGPGPSLGYFSTS